MSADTASQDTSVRAMAERHNINLDEVHDQQDEIDLETGKPYDSDTARQEEVGE